MRFCKMRKKVFLIFGLSFVCFTAVWQLSSKENATVTYFSKSISNDLGRAQSSDVSTGAPSSSWWSASTPRVKKGALSSSWWSTSTPRAKEASIIPCDRYISDVEPYKSRLLLLREKCPLNKTTSKFLKSSFKYTDEAELVMCETPKVASTSWQYKLLRLGGFNRTITKELAKKWDYSKIPNKNFNKLNKQQMEEYMTNYTTFFVTRHPFERLVSAYYDKLTNRSTYKYYRKHVGTKIANLQAKEHLPNGLNPNAKIEKLLSIPVNEQNRALEYLNVMKSGEVTFLQFVKHLIGLFEHKQTHSMDVHWRPQTLLCQPCHFNYDVIIKFENVAVESNQLLKFLEMCVKKSTFPKEAFFSEVSRPKTGNLLTQRVLQGIPEYYVDKLRQIYDDDFKLFGYDPYLYKGRLE